MNLEEKQDEDPSYLDELFPKKKKKRMVDWGWNSTGDRADGTDVARRRPRRGGMALCMCCREMEVKWRLCFLL